MLPDCPLTTDDCATKIGAGLCRSHASKARCTIKEADNNPVRRFETAGYSGANISGVFKSLSAILPTIRRNRYNVICEPNPEVDGHVGDSPSPSGRGKLYQNLCRAEDSCPLAVRTGLLFSQ